MLKPHLLERALTCDFGFCATLDCPVLYFDQIGSCVFTSEDLRVIVGAKATTDPIPLCYCFGFDESHIRNELAETGGTTVPERIAALIREGLCECESRNPSGVCCLGDVRNAVKRLVDTSRMNRD